MAEALIYEFTGVDKQQYDAVNEKLGLDSAAGTGDWPAGLLSHIAGSADDGTFVVSEIWASREAQDEFMNARLGAALADVSVPAPSKVTWVSLIAHVNPNG
jgi:hypothetical protein